MNGDATYGQIEEQSLELLIERMERRQAREEDDREAELNELIAVMSDIRNEPATSDGLIRFDEFLCRSCHMIEHRSQLADPFDLICADCAPIVVGAR